MNNMVARVHSKIFLKHSVEGVSRNLIHWEFSKIFILKPQGALVVAIQLFFLRNVRCKNL